MFTSVRTISGNRESYRLLNWVITYVIRKQIIYKRGRVNLQQLLIVFSFQALKVINIDETSAATCGKKKI